MSIVGGCCGTTRGRTSAHFDGRSTFGLTCLNPIEPRRRANDDTSFVAVLAKLLIELGDPRAANEVRALDARGYRPRGFRELCERNGFQPSPSN